MKTISCLLVATALISTTTAASAYRFSPPDIKSRLRGTLVFTPNEGGGTPFMCKVIIDFKTRNGKLNAVNVFPFGCGGVGFQNLPWRVFNLKVNSGEFGVVSFTSSYGNCGQEGVQFQESDYGVWTLPAGQCLSGTLTSHPPVTIVK